MNFDELKKIDVYSFLKEYSILTYEKRVGNEFYFRKPGQKTGSVAVNRTSGFFYDHADGIGGGIVKAINLYYSENLKLDFSKIIINEPFEQVESDTKIKSIHEVQHPALIQFFNLERKIALKYLPRISQINFTYNKKYIFSLAWKNLEGGYNTQNAFFKRVIGANAPTLIDNGQNALKINVFEAYFDYLAYLTHTNDVLSDAYILNSTSFARYDINLSKYDDIDLYLDNDSGGDKATIALIEIHERAKDKRFYECNDYNDFIKIVTYSL